MEPPAFSPSGLCTVRAAPGSDATLVLPVPTGSPPFNYQWSRAGASLDERFTAAEDAAGVRLTVTSANTGDTNVYTLQASNEAGSDTSRVRLEVCADEAPTGEDPPTFLRRLQDLTVKVGTRTRFLVEIISSTECKVTWFRNERRLLEAERVALARDGNFWCADVAAVSVDDAGRWTCTAENAGGRASCSAHLNVLVPKAYKRPEFMEELRALLTEQGTVSLECKVVGVPTPVLRWFKDSREIKAGDVFALTANAEDPTSLGTYTCEAVNCMGRAYSSSKVHVVGRGSREGSARPTSSSVTPEPPPIFTKELEDQFVRICEPLTLGCHIVVPPWPRSVIWYNKEGKIEPSERYHVLEDGAGGYLLEVPSAEWPDEGEWKCVATSTGGRVGISTCYVTMDVPKNYRKPRFMENLQAVLTEEGLVSFECKVVGFPTPVLSWFKDGQELKPGDVYQLTGTNSLGSYCCIARNCMGQASSSAELTVEDIQNQLNEEEKLQLFSKNQAPKFIQGLKSVEAKIDESFRFTVKVAIPPEPSVLWYRDDQPVDESSRCHHGREDRGVFYLDIQSLEFLDQAEWKCVAMNDFGHSVTSCFLKLIIPRHYKKPRFLENLQAILSDEGAVNLECKVIGVPQPVLKWYKDGEELKPGDIHRIISGQDGTCCLGTYTCEAQNCMGIAASSASLLGFDDSMKAKKKKAEEQALQRNLSLSTIHEERTSQMYDTPVGDVTTLDDKGEISFSFDGKEVSVSLYETPDLTEEEALQIVEMYADQLSENITEHNVVELPPLRFVKETSTSGNLLMEAVIIDVSPEYFVSPDEDMRTEADIEDISIADENGPPQLSLDQDIDIGGEDYLEKTMAMLSEEKSDISLKFGRKKSDSQRSADDFYSLSREHSLSEEKRDDDTQAISDLQSFASAHSLGKPKSKSSKPSGEDGQESSEPSKTILHKDEALKHSLDAESLPVVKPKRERRTSRSSRRSSSGSEKSVTRSREEVLRKKESFEMEMPKKTKITDVEFKEKITDISTSLSKVINDVQIIERDIILKSELMSSAATASRSLEIISSLISPLSEIHSIADAAKESVSESKEVSSTLFNSLPQPLKSLQQSLTIIEKCIDMESDSKTLVKKTCVAFIETCGSEIQKLISNINSITSKDYLLTEDRVLTEIESLNNEMSTVIKFSADTIKARNLLNEANEIKVDEPSVEVKHIRDTQKAVFELKSPLMSLLCIAESADSGKIIDIAKVRNSEVILNDMSGSIQDLQTALEQIETLSVKESNMSLHKYNTEIIETVMESVVKLRSSFEQLSKESEGEDKDILNQAVTSIKENLNIISSQIEVFEKNVGTFDVLQSENKLDALQKMAQILIALENNLPRLDTIPEVKNHMTVFHKNLTKVLENVIESNESKKYFTLMEICDAVNRINASIKNLDADNVLPLASLNNTLRIIQDQFITNVFDSELNCSVLTNIADTLLGIQEAINTADEVSTQIDSEHIKDITPHVYDETKAKVVVEHIDHTIAAIENVKAVESTQDIKLSLTPALENIRPVLEELRRTVASIKSSGAEEEHVSDLSEISSFAKTFASPLWDLNQNIIVLNQNIVENIESLKENCEIMATIAQPLHELHTTLEILQQDVISQYGEDLTPYDVSVTMASAVQNLQSCIVLIQEQAGMEATEEMSTLEDISGIKTTADTLPSDRLVLPTAEETAVEQTISPFNQELQTTATAQALQTLNEHITVLQTTDIIDALDSLSEISDYSSLKSFVIGLGELHSGIEEVLHPLLIEGSNELGNLINPSKLTAIAEPMQELQQSLSVLDTSNIPIYENLLEMPTERIHSVIQTVSEFKEHLDKCMFAVFPALHTADNTEEIANKVGALREVCEHLKDIIETTKAVENVSIPEEVKALERTVNNLLDVTDVSKGIKIEQVKSITEELYQKVATVQDEMIQFTPHAPEKLAQEAKLIQTIDLVQSNIAVLQQYDFVDLSRVSDLTCTSPQMAIEIESDSLMLMEDIVDSAVNVVQDSSQNMPIADLMIVEDFFKTCKNEFTILRCLISKATTHKKIIRLLQEFSYLQSTINDFKTKRFELSLSDDISGCLTTFLIHAEDCLQNVQTSLLKIVDSQADLLIEAPLAKFENSAKVLKAAKETKHDEYIIETVNKFVEILETAKPTLQNVQADILDEIKSTRTHVVEDSKLVNMIEEFATFVEVVKNQNKDVVTKDILEKVSKCIEKHHDFRDASGTGKTLILLKCLSDCTDVLQESLLEVKIPKRKVEEGPLKAVLTEMLEPLQALHSQLTNIQDQVLKGIDEDSISVDISTTESLVHMMTEKHNEMIERMETEEAIANEEISLIIEVDKEIHSIQDSLRSMESVQVAQVVKEIAKPVENIEKSMHNILSSEKLSVYSDDKLPKEKAKQIIQHIDQYIDLIEIVEEISAIIKIDNIEETVDIAKELRESIAASEITIEEEMSQARVTEVREEQTRLARKLQTALTAMRVQVFENAQELAPELSTEILQRIAKVTAQLQADLVAVTGVRVALQAPAETLLEIANTVETLEGHAASVTATELSTVASGSEAIILEQVGFVEQLLSPKQLLTTTDMLEKAIVETKEVITSEHAQVLSTEIQMESIQGKTNEAIAIEGTEAVFVEQTESVSAETTSTEYANFSIVVTDQAQEVASVHTLKTESISAVVVEDLGPVLHEVTVDEKQVDVGISQTAKLQDAPQATIDLLIQHIDQFISDDITEIISELSHVINAEELKQSINIAKELRENIAASEVELKAETSDVLKHKVEKQQAKLLQQLYTALAALDTLPLDSLGEIPSINKDNVQRVAEITENLRLDLITVAAKQNVIEQVESTTSQLKPLEFEVGEQIELPAHDSAEVQEESIKAELENLLETNQHSRNQAQLEAVEISTTGAEKLKASTLDTQPSSTEEVTVSGVKTVITEQTLQKSEDQFKIAKTAHRREDISETLLQNINEFLSDNIVQSIDKISSVLNVAELKQSVAVACELRESIANISPVTEIGKVKGQITSEQALLALQLQNALSTAHVLTLDSTEKLTEVIGKKSLQQLFNTTTQLSEKLDLLLSEIYVQQESGEEKPAVRIDDTNEITNNLEALKENCRKLEHTEQITSKAKAKEDKNISSNITEATTEVPILECVIASDDTSVTDQGKVEPIELSQKQITEDITQATFDSDIKPLAIETSETVVTPQDEILNQHETFKFPENLDTIATITPTDTHILEQAVATSMKATVGLEKGTVPLEPETTLISDEATKDQRVESTEKYMKSINQMKIALNENTYEQLSENANECSFIVSEEQVQRAIGVDTDLLEDLTAREQVLITNTDAITVKINNTTESRDQNKISNEIVTIDPDNMGTDDGVMAEAILLEQCKTETEPAVKEQVAQYSASAGIIITTKEDVKLTEHDVHDVLTAPIEQFGKEIVDTAIVIAGEVKKFLERDHTELEILHNEELTSGSEINSLKQIRIASDATIIAENAETVDADTTKHTYAKEQATHIHQFVTDKEHADIITTQEDLLQSQKPANMLVQSVIESDTNSMVFAAENTPLPEQIELEVVTSEKNVVEYLDTETVTFTEETKPFDQAKIIYEVKTAGQTVESVETTSSITIEEIIPTEQEQTVDIGYEATIKLEPFNQAEKELATATAIKYDVEAVEKFMVTVDESTFLQPKDLAIARSTQLDEETIETTATTIIEEVTINLNTEPTLTKTVDTTSQVKCELATEPLKPEKEDTNMTVNIKTSERVETTDTDEKKEELELVKKDTQEPLVEIIKITPEITEDTIVIEPQSVPETTFTESTTYIQLSDSTTQSDVLPLQVPGEIASRISSKEVSLASQPAAPSKMTFGHGLIEHIDEFISDEISELVNEVAVLTNSEELKESIKLAKVLKESIEFSAISEESSIREVAKLEQAKLIQMLQGALSILHPRALEMVEGISPIAKPEALQRVAEIISQLQKDLETAFVSGMPDVLKAADIVQIPEVEGNTMKQLKVLLQEVTDKVNLPTERNAEDTEALRNVLDEVQTVIIKLKRDYDGAAYDTLNETLEDLECSVRSVQLQINEDSPPELLKEACATLQLLVNNMRETQEIRVAETTAVEVKNENILEKCSIETDETVKLLELASKTNIKDSNLAGIVSSLNILTETIKTLKLSFMSNADVLIEKGVDVVQSLNQLEDKVFMLEKDLAEVSLHTEMRDHILTAVHSVYGSISNMRGTISSIQKRYMFENYGKPSETLLRSIKNISAILEIDDAEVLKWKVFSKSLRKVLNHFEDIKFFINLDKTARLPSDAAFTKIILDELKSNICEILVPQSSILGEEAIEKVNKLLQCVNKSLNNIEAKSTLEVKEKIPVFKELSSQIFGVTDFIKAKMSEISKETKPKVIKEELDSSKLQNIPNIEQELVEDTASFNTQEIASINTGLKENVILLERLDDIGKTIKESPSTSQVAKEETSDTQVKERKQVIIQEIEIESEIEKIASELINNIAAKAIAIVQNLEGTDIFEQTELFPEKISQCIEPVQENIEESPITIEDPKLFESINEENKPQPSFEGTVYTTEEPIVADNSQAVDIKPELEPEVESTEKQVKNTSIPDTQTENVSSKVEKSKEKEQKEKEETEEFSDDQIKELVQELPMQEIKVPEEARISVEQKQIDVEDYEVHETKPIHAVTKKNTTNEVSDLAADMLEEGEKDKKPTKKTDKQHSISNEEPAEIEEAEKWEDSLTDVKDQFSEPSTSKITAKHGEDTSFQDISTEEIDKDKLEKELLQEQQQQGIITDTLDEHQQKQVEKKILEEDNLGDVQKIEESQGTEQETKQVIAQVSVKQTNNNDVDLKGIETTGDQEKQSIQQTEPQAFKEQETLIHNEKAEDLKVESQESQKEETCIPKELISIDVLESKKKEHEDLEKIKPKLKEQKILVPEEEFDLVEEEKDSKENKLKKKRNEEESTSKVVKFAKEIPKEDLKVKAETQEWEEKVEEDKQKCDKIKQNDKAEQNEEESKAKILIQAKKTVDAVKEESIKTEIDNAEAKMEDDKAQLQKGGEITKNSSNLLKVEENRIENEKEADMAETLKKCTEDEDKSKSVFEVKQKETGKTEQKGIQFENKQSEIEEQDKKLLEVTEKTVTLKEEVLVEAKNIGLQIEKQDSKNTEESEKKTKEIEHKEIAKFEAVRAEQLDIEKDVTEKKNQLKERKENEDAEKVHDEKKKEDEEEKARLQAERILYEQKLNLKEEAEKARLETEKKMSEAEKQNKEIEVEKKRVEEEEIKMKENEKAQAAKNKKDEEEKARFEVERVLGEEKLEKDRIEAEREKKLKELQEKARLETENKIKEEAEKLKQEAEIKIIEEKEIAEKKNLEEEKARLEVERVLSEEKLEKERIEAEQEKKLKGEEEKARLETEKNIKEEAEKLKQEAENKILEEKEIAKKKKEEEEKARLETEKKIKEEADKLKQEAKNKILEEKEIAKKKKEEEEKARLETEKKIKEEAEKLKQEAENKILEEKEIAKKKKEEEEKARLETEKKIKEEADKLKQEAKNKILEEKEIAKKKKEEEEKARLETEKKIKEEAEKLKQEAENKILEEKEIAKKKKEEEEKARLETEKKIKEEADKLKQEAKNKILEEKEIAKKKEEKAKFEGEQKPNEAAENLEKERVELEKETIRKGEESKKLKEEKEKARLESEKKSNEDHIMLEQETKEEEDEEKDRLETVKQQNDDAKKIEKEVLEPEQKHLEEEQRVIKVKEESKKSNVMKKKLSEEEKAKLETEKETNNEADRLKKEQIELEKKKKQEDEEEKARLETVNQQNNEAEKLEKDRTEAEKKRLEKEESEIKEKEKSKKKKVTKKKTKEEEDAKSETAKKIHDEAKGLKKEHIELEQKTKQEEDEEKAGLETVKQQNNEAEMLEKEQVEAENKSFIIEEREMKEKDESKQKKKLMKSKEEAEEIKLKAEKKQKEDAEQLEKVQFEAEKKQKERAEKSQLETEMKLNKEAAQHDKEINESENKQLEKEAEKRKLEMEQFKAQNLQLVVEERDEKVKENTEKKKLIKQNKIQEKNQSKEKGEGKIVESQILEEKVKVDVEQKGESHDDYQKDKTVFKQKKNEKDSNEIGKQGTVTKHEEEIELKQKEEFNLAILTKHKEEEEARLKKESLDKQRSKDFRKEQQDSETQQTEEGSLKTEEDVVRADKLEKSKNRKDEEENSQINSEIKRKQEQDAKFKKEKQEVEIRETEELNKKKVQEEQRIKQENEVKLEKEKKDAARKEEKSKKEAEKKLKQEKEAIATKQKKDDEKKHTDEEKRVKELQEAKEKEDKLKQEEAYRLEKEKKKAEKLEKEKQEEKLHEEEERARQEKKRVIKKKREEEESRFKAELEAEKARKDAARKRKDTEKTRLLKEQEQAEARETEIRETEKRIREERRREIENDLIETKKKPKLGVEIDTSTELTLRFDANGNSEIRTLEDDHYIREYQYEPTRGKSDDRTKFVDQNHKDYTMEFLRPSGYRERGFEHEKYSERETLGKNATIYKAQTIILDSQLRSSAPPQSERSQSEIRMDRYDRGDSEKRVERHRSKALSEVRSMISEKRSGLSRDSKRKPVFSTYLTDRTAVEGSRVKLTCSVLSSTDPRITWYKNGVFLDDKLKYRTKFIDGLITLEVLNAVVSDSAEYSCTVENENGSVNTSANLKVYPSFEASPIPPTFTRSIRDTFHLAENELVLECRIRGQPLPTITWLKDDKPVSGNERYQAYYLADGVCRLAISSPTPEDSGKYTCKAENSVWSDQITHIVSFTGKETRLNQNITTIERSRFNRQALESRRPHFTNVLSDYKVAKGGTIGLQVEIKGCPTRVEWLQEGRNVTEVYRNARTFVEQGLYTLALSDVTEKESGMYTCRAWSTHGNVDMNAAITVVQPNELEGKPAIIVGRPEKDILISVGEDVNISFRVQGEPKPKVVFMKGIRDITTNQRVCKMTSDDYVKFTLKRSVVSDAGTYCILARNAYGCDRAFVTVVVRQRASSENLISDWTYPMDDSTLSIAERKYKSVPDRIPGEPSVVDGGNNWVSLAWPKADPRDTAPVLAYKIESWLLGKEGGARWVELGITPLNSFDAFNLKQGEEYHFRVTPRNRYGWGESVPTSIPIGIGLAGDRPEFVEILPGQLKVLAGEKANLSCSIKGKPVPEIVWMKNGHEIEEESRMTTLYNGQDCSLTIKDICIEDEARYSCEASNVHGRASTYARLAVVTDRLIWEADAKLKRERSQDAEGDYPPQFTMRLRDRRVQATYPVRLTCQVVGNPPPTITWFKDGELLVFDSRRNKYQDEHFHTLEIAPTSLEDGGVYEAMARNSSGAVSCRCSLVVDKGIRAYVAPEFCCGLEPLYRLSEGEELRISAVVEAYPSVGVTWYRDGVRLRPSRRAIMTLDRDGQIELALAAVTARDAGVYTCTASNEVGRASTSGKVDVIGGKEPLEKRTPPVLINAPDVPYSKEPMFVRKPRSSEAREGDTVIIACEVIGDPKPDVYWLRDFLKPDYYRDASHFKRVGDGPEYRFEIPHAKLDYTGAYSVVARNIHGEAKAIISLQILAKDPSSTDDSHNVRYGRVEVIPRFDRELTDLLSYDGDAVEFECHVTGNPEPDIRWFHYNELIRDCPDFESSFDEGAARLKIKQVTAEDEGTYSCEASNNLGKATSSACLVVYPPGEPNTLSQRLRRPPALLSAASTPRSTPRSTPARSVSRTPGPDTRRLCSPSRQMAPSFYTYPFNKVVEEGDHVTFKCAVKGQPSPWATWDKDGIIITPSARFTIREKDELLRILEIEQVTIEDVGIYRITVENEFGRAEAAARLEVITQKGKFYGGVRAYSPSPRKSLTYRRYPSVPRQD